ncbi:MAG: hypothetical protein HY706_08550 [Candidatus Hydrogenedentes bacterium]|nr:hypothetical protein [Candidatus Hydrogenedentota bacterium]
MRLLHSISDLLLLVLAFLWPLGVYGWPVSGLSALLLVTLWLTLLLLTRKTRIPFELAWPAAIILILVLFARTDNKLLPSLLDALFFFGIIQLAGERVRIESYLFVSAVGGALLSIFTCMAWAGWIWPTAYSLHSGMTLAGPRDLSNGALALIVCFLCAVQSARSGNLSKWLRVAAAVSAVVILVPLPRVLIAAYSLSSYWTAPFRAPFDAYHAAIWVVFVWLAARIAAKLEVSRRDNPTAAHAAFLAIIAAEGLWVLCTPSATHGPPIFLLALAAAYALPETDAATSPLEYEAPLEVRKFFRFEIAPALLMLVGYNTFTVWPSQEHDPRNYEVTAAKDFADGRLDNLRKRMDFFEGVSPGERRTHWWRAQSALSQGLPHSAATEFARAMKPVQEDEELIIPPPSTNECQPFLVALRDHCSALPHPERSFAYEKALIAAGRPDEAIASLRLRAQPRQTAETQLDVAPLVSAVLFLLGSNAEAQIRGFSAPELVQLLVNWGAQIHPAPRNFSDSLRPLILIADLHGEGIAAFAGTNATAYVLPKEIPSALFAELRDWSGGGWTQLMSTGDGNWQTALIVSDGSDNGVVAQAIIESSGTITLRPIRTKPFPAPESPATSIWID